MYQYMKEHETFIKQELDKKVSDLDWLMNYHLKAIAFVQHERLIHLLVTFFFAFLLILSVTASFIFSTLPYFLLDLILFIVLLFYIRHYYRLENGVQYWYNLYKEMAFQDRIARRNK